MDDASGMPSLQAVVQAIHALYRQPDTTGKEKASVWLGELQRSVSFVCAWKIADELLQQNVDLESCYFAAQTMRTKIQYVFHELPPESHVSLRDSLMEHLAKVTKDTAPVIVTQLSLAMADLALQMAAWKSPVVDLITRFGCSMSHIPVLLEVLTVLPEELNSRSLRLGANRRNEIIELFTEVSGRVVHLLDVCLQPAQNPDERVRARVFRCLGSWFSVGGLRLEDPVLHKLLGSVFEALKSPTSSSSVHETATDCVCNALMLIGQHSSQSTALAQVLVQGVYSLVESYHLSVAHEDLDRSVNYCRIFTELAESLLDDMIQHPGQGLGDPRCLDLLLTCVGHYDYEVAEITFNLWYRLSEALYKESNDALNAFFGRYIQMLLVALCRHCQLDPDKEGVPSDKDDFGDFRNRVAELIKDVVYLVGSANCFHQMFENLKNQGASATWDVTEATLFAMAAVAKNVVPEENDTVPEVVEAILKLPAESHAAVRHTSIQLLGELCEWIDKHPQYLDPVLTFLLQALQTQSLASVAAASLQNVCATCRSQMVAHFPALLHIVSAVDTLSVSTSAALGLLKGAVLVLAKMSPEQVTDGMRQLCRLQTERLTRVMNAEETNAEGSRSEPIIYLDRLAAIFRNTNVNIPLGQPHPCQPVVEEVWPVLSQACHRYQADEKITEQCCRCIRFAVRCIGRHSHSLLQPLVTQMVQLYQVHQHSCFLYLGSILVDEYGSEAGCVQGLIEMLQAFCGPAFRLLANADALRNHPDTVDDLFRLCTRYIQRMPVVFLKNPALSGIIQCALAACPLDHREANTSVMKFLCDLIHCGRAKKETPDFAERQSLVGSLLSSQGQTIVTTLIQSSIFCLPTALLPDVAEVLYELIEFDRQALTTWLENALKLLPTHGSGGAVTATPAQLQEFLSTVTSAEHMRSISTSLRDFSRLYR
ncbi:transportin-3 isoform X1 [Dermacentor andersoni]|uniref:transportin-3 isoform X1 n=1 Tax=Dermacentor andersoni TaxID=34620 RepID=UPI002155B5F5|nr:transportin-3-like isoform X1 [Dermacentor andersoni]